ncbi:dehydrogenase [Fibrisoma montanum]|uniref:Dehydrogenase n=1 Tax=Fibrisoma montanum TaxID=2305895 RepID=A0A418M194_9BACT|nr:MaoC family dehydratase [Fibrisoma montanum]RIV19296.1 dehydrogenase [Fibrisoma montanum]
MTNITSTSMQVMQIGETYSYRYQFSQEDVEKFAEATGDDNPLHLDPQFAANTPFKRPIVHGMLSASVLAKVFGKQFGGSGGVHLSQTLDFVRPMYVDTEYEVRFFCKEINCRRHTAEITSEVFDLSTGKVTLRGTSVVFHRDLFA